MANVTAGTKFATAIAIANADLTTAIANATNTTCEDSDIGYVTFIDSWYCKLIAGLCTFAAIGKYSPLTKPKNSFFPFQASRVIKYFNMFDFIQLQKNNPGLFVFYSSFQSIQFVVG